MSRTSVPGFIRLTSEGTLMLADSGSPVSCCSKVMGTCSSARAIPALRAKVPLITVSQRVDGIRVRHQKNCALKGGVVPKLQHGASQSAHRVHGSPAR